MKILSRKEIEDIVKVSFQAGENWGVTYSTWFTPDESDTNERVQIAIDAVLESIGESHV